MDKFKTNCEKNGITTVEISFSVTTDVYNYLIDLAEENDCDLKDFMRSMVDFFIENEVD